MKCDKPDYILASRTNDVRTTATRALVKTILV